MGEYSFIKEVVKEKPLDKRALILKMIGLAAGGVLFGLIAAFVFVRALSTVAEEVPSQEASAEINIEQQEPEVVPEAETTVETTTQVIEIPAELGLADYKKIYQEMTQTSQKASKSVVTVVGITDNMDWFNNSYENQTQVSGIIVAKTSQELYVLTEYRCVEHVDRIRITFWNNASVDAHFQKCDPNTGLCVLTIPVAEVEEETLNSLLIAPLGSSSTLRQGDPIMALGSPMGYSDALAFGMVTSVSNKVSTWDREYFLITTDIQGTKEGSGVLINLDGQIVGIILQNYSISSNMVTCIGISGLTNLMERLSNDEELTYMGIKGQEVTDTVSEKTGIPKGIYVNEVQVDSPAMLAGFMSGDVIVKMRGKDIVSLSEYTQIIDECAADQVIKVRVMRKGVEGYKEIVFDVTVGAL